jgi:hypothetical protein
MHVEAMATGHPEALQLTGRFSGHELTADRFSGIALDTEFAADLGKNRGRLTSVRARSPLVSVTGAADVALAPSAGESKVDARFDVANLQKLLQLFKVPVSVSSRVAGNVRGSWPGGSVEGKRPIPVVRNFPDNKPRYSCCRGC